MMTVHKSPADVSLPESRHFSGMKWIPGGDFLMGSDHHYPEEAPAHRVSVSGFWMDVTTVTNREFARFGPAPGTPLLRSA